ncbi:MAG: SUMF1/EgtB/PvdO family nonheme iron enzyme, partial [Verrucomicrobia bacterium]|nr:SUMF1/EgtB/PvdO family nonheme iron enzyme [Verrucomicrobiota bacterium]
MIGLYTTLAWLCPEALAQASIQLSPSDSNNTFSLTVTELPATGVAVIWRSTNLLAKGEHWSAVHAFPSQKQTKSDLPVRPSKTDSAFFKLSWQNINVPKNMIWLPPGDFKMGSPDGEPKRYKDEGPVHSVTIDHGFWMDRYEMTQERFTALMGNNPSST